MPTGFWLEQLRGKVALACMWNKKEEWVPQETMS